ncbi:collagen-like protein [Megavirus baoshan]|uniref:Collagen-like protein n=1 Tax=Megavirus baoshan TaxID=2496520 RepID=A0A3Q8U8W1_9VIRU|nr:collagen-like protein [Megavirus baoshan]AZL89929.1 collagen-like protein [Megavirus baoshan]
MSNFRRSNHAQLPLSRNGNNNIYKYIDNKFEQLYNKINSEKYVQYVPSQPGSKGESGSRIFIESNDPTQFIGSNGDVFINNFNWYLYKKVNNNWVYMGTFKGADGLKGENGRHGLRGLKGDKGDKGDLNDKGETGSKGDKGDQGEKGDKGDQGDQGQVGEQGIKGDSNLIFTFEYTTPGNFSVTVPEGAVNAVVTMTGGGGAGGTESDDFTGFTSGGGGAGTIYQYPVSVTELQEITGTIGTGGISGQSFDNGTNSTLTIGPYQFICFGGKGSNNDPLFGGTGETVSFPIASQFFPLPASGGGADQNGSDGNIGTNAYSGAGGGGAINVNGAGGNGGMVLGFRGGINGGVFDNSEVTYYGGSGGGASALANGGNGGTSDLSMPNGQPGSRGSGGGGGSVFIDSQTRMFPGGNGGDGYVSIAFYSS